MSWAKGDLTCDVGTSDGDAASAEFCIEVCNGEIAAVSTDNEEVMSKCTE